KVRKVGGNEESEVDVRIISATNKDLNESMKQGEFRSDLFYRLNVISIYVPPLRERKDDIPLLLKYFLKIFNKKFSRDIDGFEREALELLINYPWPGNIRELENVVERSVALEKALFITTKSLPSELVYNISDKTTPAADIDGLLQDENFDFQDYIDDISQQIILKAFQLSNSNMKKTAEMLKLNYRSLRYLMDKYDLKKG
ncbi:MAG: sigma-54-dependent Fis family transcriptional regulator, partial [Candidatus Aminicenantes bacterium]